MPEQSDEIDAERDKKFRALDEGDIALLKTYGSGPYNKGIKGAEGDIKKLNSRIQEVVGIKESDTGLAPPAQWDLISDKQMMQEEQPLQARTLAAPLKHAYTALLTAAGHLSFPRLRGRTHPRARSARRRRSPRRSRGAPKLSIPTPTTPSMSST